MRALKIGSVLAAIALSTMASCGSDDTGTKTGTKTQACALVDDATVA